MRLVDGWVDRLGNPAELASAWAACSSSHTRSLVRPRALPHPRIAPAGRVWEGQYSSEAHLEQQLSMLDDYVSDPTDWIMPVDVDEFVDFGGRFIK